MNLKEYMLEWNIRFPLDRAYRKKYNIAFGSEQHRSISQIDILLEYLEDELYEEYLERAKDEDRMKKELEKGIWLRSGGDELTQEEEDALFDKIKRNLHSTVQIED